MSATASTTPKESTGDSSTPPEESPDEVISETAPASRWKRAFYVTLLILVAFLAYVVQNPDSAASKFANDLKTEVDRRTLRDTIRQGGGRTSASNLGPRYSRQYKYRPAASPVVTEQSKNGKVKVRGKNLGETY